MPNIEAITLLAVVEAQDKASSLLEGIFGSLDKLAASFTAMGESAAMAMTLVDEGLLEGATASERLSYAEEQLAVQQNLAADAAERLGAAEALAAEAYSAANEGATTLAAANEELRISQLNNSIAARELRDVQNELKDAEGFEAEVLRGQLIVAQEEASASALRLTEAQKGVVTALETYGSATRGAQAAARDLKIAQDENSVASLNFKNAQNAAAVAQEDVDNRSKAMKDSLNAAAGAMTAVGAATLVTSGFSVKLAGDFQQQTQTLVAGAGVSSDKIDGVRQSILQMAVDTGTATKNLTESFFQVNSRLGDVKQSTDVVRDAAELAKVHMADEATVATALADALNAYKGKGLDAAKVSNILGVAVEEGGMNFQSLSTALSQVGPIAASVGISLEQVAAALAVMTQQGMSTDQASQDLRHTIEKLQSPTDAMRTTWNQIGLTQAQVAAALKGPGGLPAALNLVADTAKNKVGPDGKVAIDTFMQSRDAASSLADMLKGMDPAVKQLATSLQNGSIGVKEYNKAAMEMTGSQSAQAKQFEALYTKANGFNAALKAGKPGFADFDDLLKSAFGDTTSLTTALMLTNKHSDDFARVTNDAAKAAGDASGQIKGWSDVQGTLNQKFSQAKGALEVAAITLGTALIPAVTKIVQDITPWVEKLATLIDHHQHATKIIIEAGLAIGALGIAIKTVIGLMNLWEAAVKIVTAAQWLLDAAMDANPIGIIIAAITAVIAILVYAFFHFKGFHDFVIESWKMIKFSGEQLWHALAIAFNAIGAAAMWLWHNAIDPMWHGIEGAFKAVVHAGESVWNGLVGAFNAVSKFITDIWHSIEKVTSEVWNGIKAFFEKWWPLLLVIFATPIAVIMAAWNHFHKEITDTASTVWNAIKGFFVDIWNDLKILARDAWLGIQITIISPIETVWHWLVSAMNAISSALSSAWHWIAGEANRIWALIREYIIAPMQEMWHVVTGIIGRVSSTISDGFNGILNWLGSVGDWFVNVGENIVHGIVRGVENQWHWLTDTVGNLANDALKSAKSFLGISSPSKLFADEVGQWIPQGVAKGIADHTQVAVGAVQNMAGALPAAIGVNGAVNIGVSGVNAAGTLTSTGIGLGGSRTAQGGGDIHIHMDMRDAIVAGDRGMTDLANRMGNILATQILPQAGVKLHTF